MRKIILLSVILWLLPQILQGASPEGSLTLPLADYLALLEEAEKGPEAAPNSAALRAQESTFRVEGAEASVTVVYRVESVGDGAAVKLPFPGLVERAVVEPVGGTAFHRTADGLTLLTLRRGEYRVTVEGKQELVAHDRGLRLLLGGGEAPVRTVDLDLPPNLTFEGKGVLARREQMVAGRRLLQFVARPSQDLALRLFRRGDDPTEETLARAQVMTVVRAGAEGLKRHEVVHYTVERGGLSTFEVELPSGFEARRVSTDEKDDVLPTTTGTSLVIERQRRLKSLGHLVVEGLPTALPKGGVTLSLAPVMPRVSVDRRYLVLAATAALQLQPLPSDAWIPVDLQDLPAEWTTALGHLAIGAIWRANEGSEASTLRLVPLPDVERVEAHVARRDSTTLLTADGRLVIRDRFSLRSETDAFEVTLPPGAQLWSTLVDGAAVRPVERGESLVIPLALAGEDPVVEVVAVTERRLEERRGALSMALSQVKVPVLEHRWRLLLPEERRYRLMRSPLRPVAPGAFQGESPYGGELSSGKVTSWLSTGTGGSSGVLGTVVDVDGTPLPGATVTLNGPGFQQRQVVTNERGSFSFADLDAGSWKLSAELIGFATFVDQLQIPAGRTAQVSLTMNLAAVAEELIVVTAEVPTIDTRNAEEKRIRMLDEMRREEAESELFSMARDLGGGVRPLAVNIPETGKLLHLAGALPPALVEVELEWRGKR